MAKISIQNCQNWIMQLVAKLVKMNIFPKRVVDDALQN
jgi:hypothetical protein